MPRLWGDDLSIPLPKLSRKRRGRVDGDPSTAVGPSVSMRKSARDPGLTPTERVTKERLMKQFQRMPEGVSGNSRAYVSAACWDENGRLKP